MATVKTTLNIDSEIMRKIKLIAINKNKTQTEIVNKMLQQGVINETEINENDTLEERINKNPSLKLMKSKYAFDKDDARKSFEKLKGSIKTDKPVNAVKLINEVRRGE
jgi:ribosomal protein S8